MHNFNNVSNELFNELILYQNEDLFHSTQNSLFSIENLTIKMKSIKEFFRVFDIDFINLLMASFCLTSETAFNNLISEYAKDQIIKSMIKISELLQKKEIFEFSYEDERLIEIEIQLSNLFKESKELKENNKSEEYKSPTLSKSETLKLKQNLKKCEDEIRKYELAQTNLIRKKELEQSKIKKIQEEQIELEKNLESLLKISNQNSSEPKELVDPLYLKSLKLAEELKNSVQELKECKNYKIFVFYDSSEKSSIDLISKLQISFKDKMWMTFHNFIIGGKKFIVVGEKKINMKHNFLSLNICESMFTSRDVLIFVFIFDKKYNLSKCEEFNYFLKNMNNDQVSLYCFMQEEMEINFVKDSKIYKVNEKTILECINTFFNQLIQMDNKAKITAKIDELNLQIKFNEQKIEYGNKYDAIIKETTKIYDNSKIKHIETIKKKISQSKKEESELIEKVNKVLSLINENDEIIKINSIELEKIKNLETKINENIIVNKPTVNNKHFIECTQRKINIIRNHSALRKNIYFFFQELKENLNVYIMSDSKDLKSITDKHQIVNKFISIVDRINYELI